MHSKTTLDWIESELMKLTLGHTSKLIPPPWYKGGGRGWQEPLP